MKAQETSARLNNMTRLKEKYEKLYTQRIKDEYFRQENLKKIG